MRVVLIYSKQEWNKGDHSRHRITAAALQMNANNSAASTESPLEARYIELGGKFSRVRPCRASAKLLRTILITASVKAAFVVVTRPYSP
jgi:hypothetical protein